MKTIFLYIVLLGLPSLLFSQDIVPTTAINGTYHLMDAERGIGNKPTKTKIFEYGEHNGVKLLAVAACKKCMPAVYTYKAEDSKELSLPTFFNNTGLYMFQYDSESFVMIMPNVSGKGDWTDFLFANYYSKSKMKVEKMSQQKIKEFIVEMSN